MVLASALLLLVGSASPQSSKPISFAGQVASIHRLLPELSKVAGVELLSSPQTRAQVLFLSVNEQPLSAVLKSIAQAVNGTWQKEGGVLRLVRTSEQVASELQEEKRFQIEEARKAIDKVLKSMKDEKPWDKQSAEALAGRAAALLKTFNPEAQVGFHNQFSKLTQKMPASRTIDRIMTSFDPAELATLDPGVKVVYSTNPTRTQRHLSPKVAGALAQYVRENEIWERAVEAKGVKPPEINGTTYYFGGLPNQGTEPAKTPTKALVSLFRWSQSPAFQVEMLLADEQGLVVNRANGSLYPGDNVSPVDIPLKPGDPTFTQAGDDLILSKAGNGVLSEPLPDRIKQKLLNPEEIDPLTFVNASIWSQIAEKKKKSVAVVITDNQAFNPSGRDRAVGVSNYLRMLETYQMTFEESSNWLVGTPKLAASARANAVDRAMLGQYLRRISSDRNLSVEEQAKFALNFPSPTENAIATIVARYVKGPEVDDGYMNDLPLKLYGTLTPEQLVSAKGQGLPYRAFKPSQLKLLQKIVYGPYAQVQLVSGSSKRIDSQRANNFYNSLEREPTECMPNGLPPNGLMKLTDTTQNMAATMPFQRAGRSQPPRYFSPTELAWQAFTQSRPDLFPWMEQEGQQVSLEQLRFGSRRSLQFSFQLTDDLLIAQNLWQNAITGQPTALSNLPEEFRQAVEADLAKHKRTYENTRPGQVGPRPGKNIPPR